jgi:hypothetical protein
VKGYEKHYTLSQVHVSTGEVYELDFPAEAIIQKFTVQQTGGTDIDVDVTLYNADPTSLGADAKVKHTVVPEKSTTAGSSIIVVEGSYLHRNMEGTPVVQVQKIYLELTATTSDTCTWEVALGGTLLTLE